MAPDNVLDVLTVKRSDNRPTLEMTIADINSAANQPNDDASWDEYSAGEFDAAERIELHMDYWDEDEEQTLRIVDGQVAQWDSSSDTVSIKLDRSATDRVGEYYFEWVLVYDTDAPPSDEADEVNTVPSRGHFNLTVTSPTNRDLGEADPVDRTVGTLTVEETIQVGNNPNTTISGTGDSLQFTADSSIDIHDSTDVTVSNSTGAEVTEDVTVDYYEGVDATGTLIDSETQSLTVADASSTTVTYLTGDFGLGAVDYYAEVTTTDLTADSIDENTLGAEYVTDQTDEGDLVTTDQNGRERARYPATGGKVVHPSVQTDSVIDDSDGQEWETLREVGYEKGDFIPYTSIQLGDNTTRSTTSNVYSNTRSLGYGMVDLSNVPTPYQVRAIYRGNAGGDELFFRWRNAEDGDTILEGSVAGSSYETIVVGPTDYTPATTGEPIQWNVQIRNADDATDATALPPVLEIGKTI